MSQDADSCDSELTIRDSNIVLRGFSLPEGISKVNIINCTVTVENATGKVGKQSSDHCSTKPGYKHSIPVGENDTVMHKKTDKRGYPGSAGIGYANRRVILIVKGEENSDESA